MPFSIEVMLPEWVKVGVNLMISLLDAVYTGNKSP